MSELQSPQNKPSERKPHAAVVQSTRSRVEGLEHVDMNKKEQALFDVSKVLQSGIAKQLANVDNSTLPEITEEMILVVKIAQELSGQFKDTRSNSLEAHLFKDTPIFSFGGLHFGHYSDTENTWVHAFNSAIDDIDPDNSARFVS